MHRQVFYVVHYPLVATSTGIVISYIYQWIHNRLLFPKGVTGRGPRIPPRCKAMQSQCAPSLSPWPRFLSILFSHLASLVASRSSLLTSFPHDTWSLCHTRNPMPHSWLCNQWPLPIQRSIMYAVLWCRIRTLYVSTDSIGMTTSPRFTLFLLLRLLVYLPTGITTSPTTH
jgi:hypothetical protein